MRTMKIITTVCWIITALAIAGLATWFITGTVFGIRISGRSSNNSFRWGGINIGGWENLTGPYELDGSYSVGTAGVDSIDIDWVAGKIDVRPHDGNDIVINEYAQRALRDEEKVLLNTSGSTLTVKFREQGFSGNMPQKRLEVLIPRSLCESLDRFGLDSTSGSVDVDYINAAKSFTVKSLSGSIKLTNIVSGTFNVDSTSGSVTITNAHSDALKIKTLSGSVRVNDSGAGILDVDTTSGSINAAGAFGNVKIHSLSGNQTLDNSASRAVFNTDSTSGAVDYTGSFESGSIKTLSGSVKVRSAVVPSKMKVDTTSGSITIAIPNEGSISVNHSSTSGKLHNSDIPMTMQNGAAQFELSTLSGTTRIEAIG